MKKVLISISTLGGGGAERVVSVWASQLAGAGYDVSLLLYGRSENEYAIDPAVHVYTVAASYEAYQKLGYFARLRRMREIIREFSPDVIISFLQQIQIWMMMASWGMKLRRIETVRVSPWKICRNSRAEHCLWMLCNRRADAIVVQTAEQAEYFPARLRKKCVVIPNPIAAHYRTDPKVQYADTVTHFVAAGRIVEQKNYPVMLEAFARARQICPDIRLSICGTGEQAYMDTIQERIDSMGLSSAVKLAGRTMDLLSVYRGADAFLMTSDFEGMPNALAEAMAAGLPCISTACRTGPRDLIDHGENGLLTEVGNADSIADAIVELVRMAPSQITAMGRNAREKVLTLCSEENSLARLIAVIEG